MLQNLSKEVHLRTRADPTLPPIGAIGLAFAVGIAYFLAAHLSLALLAEPDGVAVFWPAAGISSGVLIALPISRHQVQIEPSRFVLSITTPRNPYSRIGSCAGRTSSAIWWLAPRSIVWTLRRARRSQKWTRWPYLFESRSWGTSPFSNCGGSPHSLVTI